MKNGLACLLMICLRSCSSSRTQNNCNTYHIPRPFGSSWKAQAHRSMSSFFPVSISTIIPSVAQTFLYEHSVEPSNVLHKRSLVRERKLLRTPINVHNQRAFLQLESLRRPTVKKWAVPHTRRSHRNWRRLRRTLAAVRSITAALSNSLSHLSPSGIRFLQSSDA